jgi:hypothetical protein
VTVEDKEQPKGWDDEIDLDLMTGETPDTQAQNE